MVITSGALIGSAAIGALGSLGSGFVSAGASNVSSRKAFQRQQALQEQAARLNYDYSVKYNKNVTIPNTINQFSYNRQGLEKANYNPMLAVSNGASMANSNASTFTSAGQAPQHDMSQAISQGMSNAMDYARVQNETKQAESQTDANNALAAKTKLEQAELLQKLPYVGEKAKADYIKTLSETAKLENDMHYQNQQLQYLQNSLNLQRELGVMGFANAKDIANINASSTPYKFLTSKLGEPLFDKVDKVGRPVYDWWLDHMKKLYSRKR